MYIYLSFYEGIIKAMPPRQCFCNETMKHQRQPALSPQVCPAFALKQNPIPTALNQTPLNRKS